MKARAWILRLSLTAPLSAQPLPLDVQDAVSAALAEQPRLQAAQSQVQAAEARASQTTLDRWGSFEASFVATPKQRAMRVELPGMGIEPFEIRLIDKFSFTLTRTQPLWTWGALSGQRDSALQEAEAGRESYSRARQQTRFEATQSYCQAVQAIESVKLAGLALDQQKAFLRAAQSRVREGSAARLDELKADLAMAQAESALGEARNRECLARENLVSITQDPRFRSAELKPPEDPADDLPDEESAADLAMKHRPDLKALANQAQALGLGARAARASGLPSLSLRASLTQQNEVASRVFEKSGQQYQIGLALHWEALGSFRSRAKAAELKALQAATVQNERALESAVALEVRAALSNVREARERLRVQQRALGVAEEQSRIARLAYREGILTVVEAQDAELALQGARTALLRARTDVAQARAALRFALGE